METNAFTFSIVELNNVPKELWERIDQFRQRAAQLNSFRRDVKWGILNLSIERSRNTQPKVTGNLPNKYELESLYLRFRFFILENENANYKKLLKGLGRSVDDELVREFFRFERKSFFDDEIVEKIINKYTKNIRAEEIIDMWFNAYYFHNNLYKKDKLEELIAFVSQFGAEAALFYIVRNACNKVRNLNWLLKDLTISKPIIYIPNSCIVNF